MPKVLDVIEYKDDGIAIIEDTSGKYVADKRDGKIIPYDEDVAQAWLGRNKVCALLQSRDAMLT